jgi:hypothetical protein
MTIHLVEYKSNLIYYNMAFILFQRISIIKTNLLLLDLHNMEIIQWFTCKCSVVHTKLNLNLFCKLEGEGKERKRRRKQMEMKDKCTTKKLSSQLSPLSLSLSLIFLPIWKERKTLRQPSSQPIFMLSTRSVILCTQIKISYLPKKKKV